MLVKRIWANMNWKILQSTRPKRRDLMEMRSAEISNSAILTQVQVVVSLNPT